MESLRLYKIEAIIVDDLLTKDEIAKRLGSFIISMALTEVDPLAGQKTKNAAPRKTNKTTRASRVVRKPKPATQKRIDEIASILGRKTMTIAQIMDASGLSQMQVEYAVEIAERQRRFTIKMRENKGTRPIRTVAVTR